RVATWRQTTRRVAARRRGPTWRWITARPWRWVTARRLTMAPGAPLLGILPLPREPTGWHRHLGSSARPAWWPAPGLRPHQRAVPAGDPRRVCAGRRSRPGPPGGARGGVGRPVARRDGPRAAGRPLAPPLERPGLVVRRRERGGGRPLALVPGQRPPVGPHAGP